MPLYPRPETLNGGGRILIVDDHEVVRRGLALLLNQEPDLEVIGEARDGQESVSMVVEMQPDIVLLDWKMPRLDGLQAARQIRHKAAASRILMLSGAPLDSAVFDAIDQGIDGFVSKDISPADLSDQQPPDLGDRKPESPGIAQRGLRRYRQGYSAGPESGPAVESNRPCSLIAVKLALYVQIYLHSST